MKARRGAHTVYRLAYHSVWIPRYRRKVLKGDVAQRLEELVREICAARDWEIEALTVQSDHVHLFVSCPPRDAPARVMNVLSKASRHGNCMLSFLAWASRIGVASCGPDVTA
jgi:putative transposase